MPDCKKYEDELNAATNTLDFWEKKLLGGLGIWGSTIKQAVALEKVKVTAAREALLQCQQGTLPLAEASFEPAHYVFSFESYDIANTRAHHEDTNFVAMGVSVDGGAPQAKTKPMGNQNNGHYIVGLQTDSIFVEKPDTQVVFNYSVTNSGHGSQSDTLKGLETATKAVITAGTTWAATETGAAIGSVGGPIGTALGAFAGYLAGLGIGLLFPDCDGVVAVEQIAFKGQELWDLTKQSHTFGKVTHHPGYDSATGCGINSDYTTHWTIRR